jgi:ubiquitin-like-conjugating enzyme ATG3
MNLMTRLLVNCTYPSLPFNPVVSLVLRSGSDRTVRTRTYDLYITYDKYWRCPRLWLFGYTALGAPLPVQAIMEDISTDYVDKTVTMETWPYMEGASMSMATVHPCKHSHVMQIIIARQGERGEQVRVDQYPPLPPPGLHI